MKNVTFNYPCFHYYNYMSIQKLQIKYGENAAYINIGRPTIRPGLAGTVPEFKVLSRFFMESASYASLWRQKFSY